MAHFTFSAAAPYFPERPSVEPRKTPLPRKARKKSYNDALAESDSHGRRNAARE